MNYDKELYEWGRHTLRKIDELGRDVLKLDTDKKPPIPESNEARTCGVLANRA